MWTNWGSWYVCQCTVSTSKVVLDYFYDKALRYVYKLVHVLFLHAGISESLSWYLGYLLLPYYCHVVILQDIKKFVLLAHLHGLFDHLSLLLRPCTSCGCDFVIIDMSLYSNSLHLDPGFLVRLKIGSCPLW